MKITNNLSQPYNLGGERIKELESGKIVKVIQAPNFKNPGEILMTTGVPNHSLINLETGTLWGNDLDYYTFQVLDVTELVLK